MNQDSKKYILPADILIILEVLLFEKIAETRLYNCILDASSRIIFNSISLS